MSIVVLVQVKIKTIGGLCKWLFVCITCMHLYLALYSSGERIFNKNHKYKVISLNEFIAKLESLCVFTKSIINIPLAIFRICQSFFK